MKNVPILLIILDGWGIGPNYRGNAVAQAQTPHMHKYQAGYPYAELVASGEAVGLPKGEDGNSEVGHLNLGAGRVVYQDLPRINMAVADGNFLRNEAFLSASKHAKQKRSQLHLLGLVSHGSVHSSVEHLYALLWVAKLQGLGPEQVKIHVFTDGRDGPPTAALGTLAEIDRKIKDIGLGTIATICGRYFAMDRDHHWDRTEKAYRLLTKGEGETALLPYEAIEHAYQKGLTDEFIEPTVIADEKKEPRGLIRPHDACIFFNYRSDRARQLAQAFVVPQFEMLKTRKFASSKYHDTPLAATVQVKTFNRGNRTADLYFVTMTEYERGLPVSAVAFPPDDVKMPLARVVAEKGLRQLHVAETEKYPHVTYFFNGGREEPFLREDRIMIPSPRVATYDKKPEMSSLEIAECVLGRLERNHYNFIVVNLACPDMVAHTGVLSAGIKAVEAADICVNKMVNATLAKGGTCVITADHGNVEEMISRETGDEDTKHSTAPVPFMVISEGLQGRRRLPNGILADVAPTILGLMGIHKPSDMTGRNLFA